MPQPTKYVTLAVAALANCVQSFVDIEATDSL